MDPCLSALKRTPPSLTAETLTTLVRASDDPDVISALSSPAVIDALSAKARSTPEREEELTEVLLSQQVFLAASRAQEFLDALAASPSLSPLLEYLLMALLRLTPENRIHTVFAAILINFTRCLEITRTLLTSPSLPNAAGLMFNISFTKATVGTAPLIQRSLYLLINIATATGDAPSVAHLFVDSLAANLVGAHIVDTAADYPGISFQYSQLLHNMFLMLRPADQSATGSDQAENRAQTAEMLEPLVEHILLALVCERSLETKAEPRGAGLTPEEHAALPERIQAHMASLSSLRFPSEETCANLSDCLLLYCHTDHGKKSLQDLGAYPLLRELHLSTVESLGDRCYLADSLLTVIEGIIAEPDLDGVN
ncbi:hypothetical protein GL50803_00137679 [Giardia duodenalis]|uniref:Uncharacterized protein n=1 Tax=Giardia intestinalis (strain ATCC 50803 / WB clone C6) TaxID=184922 RepID=A8BSV8_GIAIC|nr:hypothetical protein GL50803_00137679 [Giardia intestinalis]KAE8305954.1 hypothetical protein GL50803_00137679 [Giardia intestinalis]|eukprot:XP_001704974.1 Hypothetical protein GL50803_137679 [Giardia lamblia ATCC 50803]